MTSLRPIPIIQDKYDDFIKDLETGILSLDKNHQYFICHVLVVIFTHKDLRMTDINDSGFAFKVRLVDVADHQATLKEYLKTVINDEFGMFNIDIDKCIIRDATYTLAAVPGWITEYRHLRAIEITDFNLWCSILNDHEMVAATAIPGFETIN